MILGNLFLEVLFHNAVFDLAHVADLAHGRCPMEQNLPSSEQLVNLLQCKVLRFWIEEVDQGQEAEVKD